MGNLAPFRYFKVSLACNYCTLVDSVIRTISLPGQAPKRDPEQIAAIEKRRKLTLKPKPVKTEVS